MRIFRRRRELEVHREHARNQEDDEEAFSPISSTPLKKAELINQSGKPNDSLEVEATALDLKVYTR